MPIIKFPFWMKGRSIAVEEQAALWEAYTVSSNEPLKGESKTGLGLAIVKKIAGALGAETGFHSQKGKGSEFYIRFPKTVVAKTARGKRQKDETVSAQKNLGP